jgi:hypothetical protein
MSEDGKTLVAQLPCMRSADHARFEKEGGVWGQQRAIRRSQITVAGAGALVTGAGGWLWSCKGRGNTWLVGVMTLPVFATFGAAVGHALGTLVYPSVADNAETTMMRRLWWAQQCAKGWDLSQVSEGAWRAQYPNVDVAKLVRTSK